MREGTSAFPMLKLQSEFPFHSEFWHWIKDTGMIWILISKVGNLSYPRCAELYCSSLSMFTEMLRVATYEYLSASIQKKTVVKHFYIAAKTINISMKLSGFDLYLTKTIDFA